MAESQIVTAEELAAMSPAERHAHFVASQVTDPSTLPTALQERLAVQAARVLARGHRQAS